MRLRVPRSRTLEESVDLLTIQAINSDNIQAVNTSQNIRAKTGPAEKGKGRNLKISPGIHSLRQQVAFEAIGLI